jgi:hypothetical protein
LRKRESTSSNRVLCCSTSALRAEKLAWRSGRRKYDHTPATAADVPRRRERRYPSLRRYAGREDGRDGVGADDGREGIGGGWDTVMRDYVVVRYTRMI